MRATALIPALLPALVLGASAALVHADDANKVAISVKGTASATADSVEVELTVSARAEESADAEKKYRHKLSALLAALKEGKTASKPAKKEKPAAATEKPAAKPKKPAADDDEDEAPAKKPAPKKDKDDESGPADDGSAAAIPFELSERGLAFGVKATKDDSNPFKAIARMNGGPAPGAEPPFVFSSKVVATIKGVKKLDAKLVARRVAQLMDLGIDAGADGADTSSAPTVHFNVDDLEALRTKAYEDAMARAKARCEKIAKLGGRQLGPVSNVREGGASVKGVDDAQAAQLKAVQNMFGGGATGGSDSPSGFEVAVEVELAVEFELAK